MQRPGTARSLAGEGPPPGPLALPMTDFLDPTCAERDRRRSRRLLADGAVRQRFLRHPERWIERERSDDRKLLADYGRALLQELARARGAEDADDAASSTSSAQADEPAVTEAAPGWLLPWVAPPNVLGDPDGPGLPVHAGGAVVAVTVLAVAVAVAVMTVTAVTATSSASTTTAMTTMTVILPPHRPV